MSLARAFGRYRARDAGGAVAGRALRGGLHARPDAFERTVSLTRWVFPYIFFMGTAALGHGGAQHVRPLRCRGVRAGAPQCRVHRGCARSARCVAGTGGRIRFSLWRWGRSRGARCRSWRSGPRSVHRFRRAAALGLSRSATCAQALARMVPMMAGIGIYAIDLVVSRRFLSTMPEGAQSYFSWAMRLCDFPQGIFVLALQAATLPSLAKLVAERGSSTRWQDVRVRHAPLALRGDPRDRALRGARAPLGGHARSSAARSTRLRRPRPRDALVAQGLGIWTVAAVRQLLPVFYALGDTRTPVIVSGLDLLAFHRHGVLARGDVRARRGSAWRSRCRARCRWLSCGAGLSSAPVAVPRRNWGFGGAYHRGLCSLRPSSGFSAARQLGHVVQGAAMVRLLPGLVGALVFGVVFLARRGCLESPELAAIVAPIREAGWGR